MRLRSSIVLLLALAVAIACIPTEEAEALRGARYVGKTAQKFRITMKVGKRHIQLLRFKIRLRCRDGGLLFDDLSDFEPARLRRKGRFADLQFGPTDEVITRGRVRGSRVTGKIRVKDKLKNGIRCDSGSVRFNVRRPGAKRRR